MIPACLDSLSNDLRFFYFTLESMDSPVGQPLSFSGSKRQTAISVIKPLDAVELFAPGLVTDQKGIVLLSNFPLH